MTQTLSLPTPSPRISTLVRFSLKTAAQRVAMRTTALVAPQLAGLWAERLFLTPPPTRQRPWPDALRGSAKFRAIRHGSLELASWRWGPATAPQVLLAHGWGGDAGQWLPYVPPLLDAGFAVIAYDQPAHGQSQGTLTGIPDFARALAALVATHGPVHAVVAHSLAGPATALALAQGLSLARVVLVSPPADLLGYSHRFARWLGLSERIRAAMQGAAEERFGVRWADLALPRLQAALTPPALVIHSRDDRIVDVRQGERFAAHWPGARLLLRHGLGHQRILADGETIAAVRRFLLGDDRTGLPAQPPAPYPAPLY